MELKNLVRVSTFAKNIGKSTECVRVWIRNGFLIKNKEYFVIDGVYFIDVENTKYVR